MSKSALVSDMLNQENHKQRGIRKVHRQFEKVPRGSEGKNQHIPNLTKQKLMNRKIFYKRRATLWDLPYWKTLKLRHNIDVMHMEKNICDSIVGTLLKIPFKTKDSSNARIDCKAYNANPNLQLYLEEKVIKTLKAIISFEARNIHCRCKKRVLFCDYSEV
jgi:hypothetical protein